MEYIYLHGFASSPQSHKAQYLNARFAEIGIKLNLLDLNQENFSHLTLTRQIQQTVAALPTDTFITIIGSSFGGLTAAWVAENSPQVQRLILLAPAFNFLAHWLPKLGETQRQKWQEAGYLSTYHYGEEKMLPLHYQFIVDLHRYDDSRLKRALPTLIIHGINDEVIPVKASRHYTSQRPWVKLIELPSDHSLTDVEEKIWQLTQTFCF